MHSWGEHSRFHSLISRYWKLISLYSEIKLISRNREFNSGYLEIADLQILDNTENDSQYRETNNKNPNGFPYDCKISNICMLRMWAMADYMIFWGYMLT